MIKVGNQDKKVRVPRVRTTERNLEAGEFLMPCGSRAGNQANISRVTSICLARHSSIHVLQRATSDNGTAVSDRNRLLIRNELTRQLTLLKGNRENMFLGRDFVRIEQRKVA